MALPTAKSLIAELRALSTKDGRETAQRYFKEELDCLGVSVPKVRELARTIVGEIRRRPDARAAAEKLAEDLWRSEIHEARHLGVELLRSAKTRPEAESFGLLSRFAATIDNWAQCDGLCVYVIGPLLLREPRLIPKVTKWAKSKKRWEQRSAAVSLIPLLRKRIGFDEALEVAAALAKTRDDMVEKAAGWLLKELSEKDQALAVAFLKPRVSLFSRLTLRYATEKLPKSVKQLLFS